METDLATTIGSGARRARKSAGLTQEDVAERIGVSAEFYGRIERGATMPSVPTLAKIAETLNASADELLGRARHSDRTERRQNIAGSSSESPEIRRLLRRLRTASASTVRLLTRVAAAIQNGRANHGRQRATKRKRTRQPG